MEIRQLEAFVAVVETGSFTAAAERVNLTQSTVSQQIKALEEELGEAVFVRGHRQAKLTEAGERLLPHARVVLDTLDGIAAEFSIRGKVPTGRLRLGASSMATSYLLPQVYEGFVRSNPGVQLLVRNTPTTDETVRQVVSGEIDVGFIAVPVVNQTLEAEPIATDEIILVVGRDHRWAGQTTVAASQLDGEPMVAFERGLSHRRTMDELLASVGAMPRIVSETNDPQIAKNLVQLGIGIALIPRWAVFESDGLHVLKLDGMSLVRDVNIIYSKRHTSVVRAFVEFCRQYQRSRPELESSHE